MSQEINVILSLQTAQAMSKLDQFLGRAATGLKQLALQAAAAYVSFEGLRKIEEGVRGAIHLEEAVGRLSERTGISIPIVEAFRQQSALLNVSMDELGTTLGKFSGNIFEAAAKGGAAREVFDRMGISLTDLDGNLRSTESVLEAVATWFSKTANGAEKARVAQDLFGRSGRALIPVLNQGAEGIRRMRDEGGPINAESVKAAEDFEVRMRSLEESIKMLFVQVANNLIPSFHIFLDQLRLFGKELGGSSSAASVLINGIKGLETFAIIAMFAFEALGKAIGYSINGWVKIFSSLGEVLQHLKQTFVDLSVVIINVALSSVHAFEIFKLAATGHFAEAAAKAKFEMEFMRDSVKKVLDDVKTDFKVAFDAVDDTVKFTIANQTAYFTDALGQWTQFKGALDSIWSPQSTTSGSKGAEAAPSGGSVAMNPAFAATFSSQWTKMLEDASNFSRDLTKFLLSPIDAFRQGFANALSQMILTGKINFAQLMGTFLTMIVQSFAMMVSNWIVSHIIMKGISIAFHAILSALGWARVAESNAQEVAKTPALATNAALASVGSYGTAVLVGVAALALIAGAVAGLSARESGGPVTAGVPYVVGEKRPELFVPSQSGYIMPSVPSGGGSSESAGGSSHNFQIHLVQNEKDAVDRARNNPDWHHMIIDVVNQKAHLIGRRA